MSPHFSFLRCAIASLGPLLLLPLPVMAVPALLNHIYRSIHGGGRIPPFTYGKRWVLRDATSGRVLTPADIMLKDEGRRVESRSLSEIGVRPGTALEVIAP